MKRLAMIMLPLLLLLGGCSQERIEQGERLVASARQAHQVAVTSLDEAKELIGSLRAQVDQYQGIVEQVGGERGAAMVQSLRHRLDQAESVLPTLRGAVDQAAQGLQAAEEGLAMARSEASTGEWIKWGLGTLAGLLLGGGGVAVGRVRQVGRALESATALADELRPFAEQGDPEATQQAITAAKRQQEAAGVRDRVRRVRARAPRLEVR